MQSEARKHDVWKRFAILILVMAVAIGVLRHFGLKQERICEALKSGISQQELIAALGAPIGQHEVDGNIWLSFRANIVAAGPISAEVDQKTEKVVRLRCEYEGLSDTWKIDQ